MTDSSAIPCPACRQKFSPPASAEVPCRCSRCGSVVVGRCCGLEWIGGGAMGDVYRGRQADMGNRAVAIKVPKVGQHRVAERFEREIVASARLKHENVVCAFDRGEQLGRPFLVMEFVAGRILRDVVDAEHPLSPRRVGQILLGVARGLAHAHQQRIVNRDLKPDNIILTSSPDETAKILDYGLALIADVDGTAFEATRTGVLLGTPGYLAPEQAADSHNVTIAADVYSLGCTGFYCLTRQAPFSASSLDELRRCHAEYERPSLTSLRPDAPAELERIILRMMAIAPSQRPSPAEIVTALERLVPRLSAARPSTEVALPERIDVVCASCGETYHLTAAAIGKQFQCRNKLCRHRFVIELPVAEALVAEAVEMPTIAVAEPYLPEVVAALAVMAEAADWPDVQASELIPTLPIEAIVAEPASPSESATLPSASEEEPTPPERIVVLPAEAIVYSASSPPNIIAADDLAPPPVQLPAGELVDLLATNARTGIDGDTPPLGQATAVEAPATDALAPRVAAPRRRRRRVGLVFEVAVGCLVLGLSGYVGWTKWAKRDPCGDRHPDSPWQMAMARYDEKRWSLATKKYLEYKADFPNCPHAADVDFFVKMCEASEGIYSTTGDPAKGLAAMQAIFKEFRDSSSYKDYQFDLYKRLQELIGRFAKRAKKRHKPADIASARQAQELLRTVSESITDSAIVENTKELDAQIAQAEGEIQSAIALKTVSDLLAAVDKLSFPELDARYRQVDELLAAHPELAADKNLMRLRQGAEGAEAGRVRYIASDASRPAAAATAKNGGSQTIVVAWDAPAGAPSPDDNSPQQVAALANGVLYVFDRSGKLLWSRRLGIDSDRLPSRVAATPSSPDAFIASSSEDRALLSLDASTGEVLWRAPTPGVVTAPLTIVSTAGNTTQAAKRRGLLPTSGGTIHVFELVLGKRMGVFQVGQPMNVGGTFDPATGLVFFPGESQRVFAIDPAKIDHPDEPGVSACRSVLFTGHASGALRSEPLVVDRYFVLIEASELDEMRLKTFEIGSAGFSDPRAKPLTELSLAGWSWFAPQTSPDRATLVTDRGELGLFGFNLDNPREEAIFPLVVDQGRAPSTRLAVRGDFRAAAVHAEEHLVWVLVDGKLQKLAIDLLQQRLKPLWKGDAAPALGIPVHEPQSAGWDAGLTLYLTTMSYDGRQFFASAVVGESGEIAWQRQLGVNPLVDPLAIGKETIVVDRSGRLLRLAPPKGRGQSEYLRLEPHDRAALSVDASGKDLMLLEDGGKPTHLVAKFADANLLAVRRLESDEWRQVKLPQPAQGRPCILGGVLVVPCADGLLHRVSIDGAALAKGTEVPFQWAVHPGPKAALLAALGQSAILLVDGAGMVTRLEFRTADMLHRWERVGDPFTLSDELIAAPLVHDDRILLVERSGKVHALDIENPGRPIRGWKLDGRPSGAAVLRGGRLLVVLDRKKLACLIPTSDEGQPSIAWSAEFAGRICGAPVVADGILMVTDESGHVSGLRLNDGERLWSQTLPVQSGPAAAAVPFGKQQLLVPLRDGTLLTLPLPIVTQEVAEVLR